MRVHAIPTGRLRGNKTTTRAASRWSLLQKWEDVECPILAYVIESRDGHVVIDTGMNARGWKRPLLSRRINPIPLVRGPHEAIGPRMQAAGLNPDDVRTVILTHLDVDHVGGIGWFPRADVLVHRPEYEMASTVMGKMRYQPDSWPSSFQPTLYDLEPEPYGPFPTSRRVGDVGDLRVVPLAGHSYGQVGVILRTGDSVLFFTADHMVSQAWFLEDWAADQPYGVFGALFYPERAVETTHRIQQFVQQVPTVLLPAHDEDAPRRLAARETVHPQQEEATRAWRRSA